jgi:ABC-type sugar transport system substrate-binding protein
VVHPGVALMVKWVAELKEKTGRSVEEWVALVKNEAPKGRKGAARMAKDEHKMGTNSAWWIAERAGGKSGEEDTPEGHLAAAVRYVEEQYAGPKEKLRPIFDELLTLGKSMGSDVKACPCKTIVPL